MAVGQLEFQERLEACTEEAFDAGLDKGDAEAALENVLAQVREGGFDGVGA